MDPVRFAITGCGGMGRRHLAGLAELRAAGDRSIDLIAVCDRNLENANDLADEAKAALGNRPVVFASVAEMVTGAPDLEAVDCTTDTGSHHIVATELVAAGKHTLVEKPIALTVAGARRIMAAAERTGAILSVAENFRRDPMNRLVRALLDDGAIGEPNTILETTVGGRDSIIITPWRHQKLTGTITVDAGVHNADMLTYLFGDVQTAFGQSRLHHPVRYRRETAGPGGWYEKWAMDIPEMIEATGEDAIHGLLVFANGRIGHWVQHHAGHGEGLRARHIYGSTGSIAAPDDRSGKPVRLELDDGAVLTGDNVLALAPSYQLEPMAAALFGGERVASYEFTFAETDRKLLALEQFELARCVREGLRPEIDGRQGLHALAVVYGLFESQVAGRAVTITEVETGQLSTYQDEIDVYYGLSSAN